MQRSGNSEITGFPGVTVPGGILGVGGAEEVAVEGGDLVFDTLAVAGFRAQNQVLLEVAFGGLVFPQFHVDGAA